MRDKKLEKEMLMNQTKKYLVRFCINQDELIMTQEKRIKEEKRLLHKYFSVEKIIKKIRWDTDKFTYKADMIILAMWGLLTILHIIQPTFWSAGILFLAFYLALMSKWSIIKYRQ